MRGIKVVNVIGSALLSSRRALESWILPRDLYYTILKKKQPGD